MLLETLVDFCDKKYATYGEKCGLRSCNHPSGSCSGSCYECLYQVHYPDRFSHRVVKKTYDCPKMLYYYVCQFSHLYTSEILHAFNLEKHYLADMPYYHILSIGCGGCADLMAFEKYYQNSDLHQQVSYCGIDNNTNWSSVHHKIERYCDEKSIKRKFLYEDALAYFRNREIKNTNIIVISYLLSYLYDKKSKAEVNAFLDRIIENVVNKKSQGQKLLVIINDLNTYKRGRDYFESFKKKLESVRPSYLKPVYKYFDTGDLYDGQKIGSAYSPPLCYFAIPENIKTNYHARDTGQQSIQLIMEVE